MKKLPIIAAAIVVVILVGGFAAVTFMDIPVQQTEITKTISNDRFFKNN
ncbi:MAG TPA: hypothetical protein VIG74_04725 [Alphaproteobacteria bacterium]|jgi:hypothetical protein